MSLHPIMAQALKPFAAPVGHGDEATLLRTLLHKEREQMAQLLRLPFKVDVSSDPFRECLTEADPDVVLRAVDEAIERSWPEIVERVAELTHELSKAA